MIKKIIYKGFYYTFYPYIWMRLRTSKRVYVAVCINHNLILTQNWLGGHKKWRLPGGGIKLGESAETAATRELKEELDLIIKPDQLIPISYKLSNICYFKVELQHMPKISINKKELYAVKIVEIDSINSLNIEFASAKAIASIAWSN
jgi:8-oxo-dGTP pyrophosphatase MutT (NUDIX family)